MGSTNQKEFNDFLRDNALWLCLIVAGIILVILGVIFFVHLARKKKNKAPKRVIEASAYLEALGGADNVISHQLVRSRIILELKDYDLVDKEKLKEAGVDSFIMMSNKLTLVIQGDAEAVNAAIFPGE